MILSEWHRQIQTVVDEIDRHILLGDDEALTLRALSEALGYSKYHATRQFRALSGMPLREYRNKRRLAFALLQVRDTDRSLLDIAIDHGFSSHEAFSRAFRAAYGLSPSAYRAHPVPVVLRTKIHPFDSYILGIGGIGMIESAGDIRIYYVSIPAHKFLHVKNYESDGYFDFWEKQDAQPGQDCDTICGLLDSMRGKLDGDDASIGVFSGQVMARLYEPDGRCPQAYGVRLPQGYVGTVPPQMRMLDVPEAEYIVFEHGPFDFERQCEPVGEALAKAVDAYSFAGTGYQPDAAPGRVSYEYFDPAQFAKRILPVRKG